MKLTCVGLGPGAGADLTDRARRALEQAEVIVGYTTYIELVRAAFPQAEFVATSMRSEQERCRQALDLAAQGRRVALVCSGDPGVYGMAGLVLELADAYPGVEVEVVPGVTAATGGAALLGAPLMNDWCCISLSDLMTPWSDIAARLDAAARTGFAICLYNPGSHGRADHLRRACDVLLRHLDGDTVCGIVRNVGRVGETSQVLSLADLREARLDMRCCAFVGTAQTCVRSGRMVTPRGYQLADGEGHGRLDAPQRRGDGAASRDEGASAHKGEAVLPCVLLFGGTTEGRLLVEWLGARGTCDVVACTATDYGSSLLVAGPHVRLVQGPMTLAEKLRLVEGRDLACIVDATHPYAQHISRSIDELAQVAGVPVVRVRRETGELAADGTGAWTRARDAAEAARYLAQTSGNILLTTGAKELPVYVEALPDASERLYVRVLPLPASVERARDAGIPARHIVALQGPASERLNAALIRDLDIRYLVTKQTGEAGGFEQKVRAARACGIGLVVVEPPAQDDARSLDEVRRLLEERYGL